jgi:diaminopimelate decarboxylase
LAGRLAEFPAIDLRGVHLHIGSQMAGTEPAVRAVQAALDFITATPGLDLLDLGGGFPVPYHPADDYPPIERFAAPLVEQLRPWVGRLQFHLEPGRYLVADTGSLLTSVQAVKHMAGRRMVIVDTGMHHLLRPALYEAYHEIWPVREGATSARRIRADVVGPVCESGDFLGLDRDMPEPPNGALLAVMTAGAYGAVQAGTYNTRALVPEVLVNGDQWAIVRPRLEVDQLIALDRLPGWL